MKKKAGILLSGCGSITGSDPFEVAFLSSSLEKSNFETVYLSISSKRILKKSSEISKGKLFSLNEISPKIIDVLAIPGGQGVVFNLLSRSGEPKKEIKRFLREIHLRKGIIVALSLGTTLLSRTFSEYNFNFDLLKLKSGNYLENKELNFIVAPATIAAHSVSALSKEIDSVVKEIEQLIPKD
jgi:enhancing lycopene biosynthesis protein 2